MQALDVTEENPLGLTVDAIPETVNSLNAFNEVARRCLTVCMTGCLVSCLSLPLPHTPSPPIALSVAAVSCVVYVECVQA